MSQPSSPSLGPILDLIIAGSKIILHILVCPLEYASPEQKSACVPAKLAGPALAWPGERTIQRKLYTEVCKLGTTVPTSTGLINDN